MRGRELGKGKGEALDIMGLALRRLGPQLSGHYVHLGGGTVTEVVCVHFGTEIGPCNLNLCHWGQ